MSSATHCQLHIVSLGSLEPGQKCCGKLCCQAIIRTNALKAPNASKTLATRARGAGARVAVEPALVAVSIDVNTLHVVAPSIDDAARHWAANHAGGNDNSLGRVLSDIATRLGVPRAAASSPSWRGAADALRVVALPGIGFGAFVQGFSGVLKAPRKEYDRTRSTTPPIRFRRRIARQPRSSRCLPRGVSTGAPW